MESSKTVPRNYLQDKNRDADIESGLVDSGEGEGGTNGETITDSYTLKVKVKSLSPVRLDPMDCGLPGSTVRGILQQEYWSGLPFPSPGDLPNPGIEPGSPAL